jgi:L-fuculokinase
MEKLAIVFDCGATNVRVVAINSRGKIKASRSLPNQTHEDPDFKGGIIWDLDEIWKKLCAAAKEVTSEIDRNSIVAITTTSFGVDGSVIDKSGQLLYPVISWQCGRTEPIMQNIGKYISLTELYKISGINAFSFNTINKLIWFKENMPNVAENADRFLFMPSLINFLLTGQRLNDITMLGTSMLTDLGSRGLSEEILNKIGFSPDLFGNIGEAGDLAGQVSAGASALTGIPEGTMVCLAGHDTQFAVFGSGAEVGQPVLSSGTWEILMTRSAQFSTTEEQLNSGITTELDAIGGLYDIGLNWLGSGIIEWIRNRFYSEYSRQDCYDVMIDEAVQAGLGSNGIFINPDFHNFHNTAFKGQISGLTLNSKRGEITRAAYEALSFQTRDALEALEKAGDFKAGKLICVGGGSNNRLWNQIRADVLNLPVVTIRQKETTVLGASFFAFTAAGLFSSPEEAKIMIDYDPEYIYPSQNSEQYQKLFYKWRKLIKQQV